jgi:signal transduction histidine kinase
MASSPPHFDISAAVVRQLGDELVSDEVTAIVELVKNAYDADASYAHVIVDTTDCLAEGETDFPGVKGYITIEDDGMGMSRADIDRGWLVISLSNKRTMKAAGEVTPKGRTPLGDKGLGRLSTQKLGHNLEMFTRKDGAIDTLHVSFTWSAFTDDQSLSAVPVSIELATGANARKKGTLLAISGLRNADVWHGMSAEKLASDLSQIIFPFAEARPFLVTLKIDGQPIDLGQISERNRNAAVGRFQIDYVDGRLFLSGKIRLAKFRGTQRDDDLAFFEKVVLPSNGRDFYDFLSARTPVVALSYSDDPAYFVEFKYDVGLADLGEVEKLTVPEQADGSAAAPFDPGQFHAEIDEFLLRGDQSGLNLSGLSSNTEIQQLVKRHVGIKVFRDGFAVKPYGINGEDWLRLGAQQTSATSYYGLRPQNVIGFVALTEATNGQLKEKTDREGFVSNGYSRNFRRLMSHATETVGDFYEWIRRNYNVYRVERMSKGQPFESGKKVVADAAAAARTLTTYAERARSMESAAGAVRTKIETVSKRIKDDPLLSSKDERRLGALLREASEALEASRVLSADLQRYAAEAEGVANIVASVGPRLDLFEQQLQDFAELAGLGLLAEALSHEVQNQTDRLMQKASAASTKARRSNPQNVDLLVFGQEVTSASSALRRQIGHLAPSLRVRRDKIDRFPVSELVSETKEHFEERWASAQLDIVIETAGEDFTVKTNRGRLTQVIDNLFLNAEYWLGQEGAQSGADAIHVESTSPRLRIWDTGRGVDPAVEESLFEPFITLKPKEQGRGLGLFIAAQILESMGCSISLLSARNALDRRYIFELDLSGIADDGR